MPGECAPRRAARGARSRAGAYAGAEVLAAGRAAPENGRVGYVVACYVLVIGALVGYGLWIQAQRRALMRRDGRRDTAPR